MKHNLICCVICCIDSIKAQGYHFQGYLQWQMCWYKSALNIKYRYIYSSEPLNNQFVRQKADSLIFHVTLVFPDTFKGPKVMTRKSWAGRWHQCVWFIYTCVYIETYHGFVRAAPTLSEFELIVVKGVREETSFMPVRFFATNLSVRCPWCWTSRQQWHT